MPTPAKSRAGATRPSGSRLRILLLIRSLGRGGAERQVCALASGLARKGHAVRLVTFYPDHALAEGLDPSVELRSLEKKGRWDLGRALIRYRRQARAFRPDVVHSFMDVPNVLAALARRLLPRGTGLVWGFRASNMDLSRYGRSDRLLFRLERRLARVPDRIVANSEAGRRFRVEMGFPAQSMLVIPNGIDATRFHPDSATREATRTALGVPKGAALVGHVGRLDPMKDHPNALEAFARLRLRMPDARLALVGDGPKERRTAAEDLAAALGLTGSIHWLGPRDDLPSLYNALDALLVSSAFGEGFPNVLGEAMATGVPCVATDVGDARAVLGDTGEIVPPRDPAALAEALERTLRAPRRQADGKDARDRILREYTVDGLVDRTEAVLADVVRDAERRGRRRAE